jgi:hypothetical protein
MIQVVSQLAMCAGFFYESAAYLSIRGGEEVFGPAYAFPREDYRKRCIPTLER